MTTGKLMTRRAAVGIGTFLIFSYVIYGGLVRTGPARHIDSRYLWYAGTYWAAGQSPYRPEQFIEGFRNLFHSEPTTAYVYPPTSIFFTLPLGFFSWAIGQRLYDGLNLIAFIALFCMSYLWCVDCNDRQPLTVLRTAWLILGLTVAGIPATLFTGQTTLIIVTCAMGSLVAAERNRPWLVFITVLIATAKPQISLPTIALLLLFGWPIRRAVLVALGAAALIIVLDRQYLPSIWNTIHSWSGASANNGERVLGLPTVLIALGASKVIATAIAGLMLLCLLLVAALLTRPWRPPPTSGRQLSTSRMIFLFSLTGMFFPLHDYDLTALAPAIVLTGCWAGRRQLALFPFMLVLSRPRLIAMAVAYSSFPSKQNVVLSMALLITALLALVFLRQDVRRNKQY